MDPELIIRAAREGNLTAVQEILSRTRGFRGVIPVGDDQALIVGSEFGHLNVVRELLHRGANVNTQHDRALRIAVLNGHLAVIRELLDNGANIHTKKDWPLYRASRDGRLEVVRELLKRGAKVHAQNDFALYNAVEYGHMNVVKELLNYGADIPTLIPTLQQKYQHLIPRSIDLREFYNLEPLIEEIQDLPNMYIFSVGVDKPDYIAFKQRPVKRGMLGKIKSWFGRK